MFRKKIEFICTTYAGDKVWSHPKPATHFIPTAYKKLGRLGLTDGKQDLHKITVKTCMPFLDAMTAGYIIPFDQDYVVDPVETDFSVTPADRSREAFGFHNKLQLPEEWRGDVGEAAGKFISRWIIKTPPGYSCLFIHPMNHMNEKRFTLFSGIVDTDTYHNNINFPFTLHKRDEQFMFKKGEALAQVIPFKRESWSMWSGFKNILEHAKIRDYLIVEWLDRYKKRFWRKKDFR